MIERRRLGARPQAMKMRKRKANAGITKKKNREREERESGGVSKKRCEEKYGTKR